MAGIHWNQTNLPNPETTTGAQQKADAALAAAKAYTDANKVTSLPWSSITGKPSTFPPSSHSHSASDLPSASTSAKGVVQLTTSRTSSSTSLALTASAMNDHRTSGDHDGRYYTKSQVDSMVAQAGETWMVPSNTALTSRLYTTTDGRRFSQGTYYNSVAIFYINRPGRYRVRLEVSRLSGTATRLCLVSYSARDVLDLGGEDGGGVRYIRLNEVDGTYPLVAPSLEVSNFGWTQVNIDMTIPQYAGTTLLLALNLGTVRNIELCGSVGSPSPNDIIATARGF